MLSLTAVVAAPAWILAHSEHLARPPGTRWWNHLPGPQPTPRRGSSRILLHRTLDEQRRICAEFLTQADEFLDVLREMTARLERAGTSDVAEDLQHRYAASWNAFATARSSVLIVCPAEVGAAAESFRLAAGSVSDLVDHRAAHDRWPKGYDDAYADMQRLRDGFIQTAPGMPDPSK